VPLLRNLQAFDLQNLQLSRMLSAMTTLRILLIADDPLARAGMAALVGDLENCEIVGQVAADDQLPLAPDLFEPDVVLWDLGWDPMPDFENLAEFAALSPALLVLLDDAGLAGASLAAGARGLLPRRIDVEQLQLALMAVAGGLLVIGPELADALSATVALPVEPLVEDLTAREMDVLQLMAEGAANKEIARQLAISENTVKYHVNAILGKLDAQSRTEAVVRATRAGLILL
jgi:two-component system nitrate/nitrite response regulator NarL